MYNPPTTSAATEDTKYTVNALLSSLSRGESSMTPTSLAFMSTDVATGTTPTLTPTTYQSLESVLASVENFPIITNTPPTTVVGGQRESGFIPPLIDANPDTTTAVVKKEFGDQWYNEESSLSEDSDWGSTSSASKRPRVSGGEAGIVAPTYGATAAANFPLTTATTTTAPPPNRRGGRRSRNDAHLSPEEVHRRNIRRERNKVAAAKCRQRRVDLTNTLINQSDLLEEEQSKLENDIQNLQKQKEQLEFLLEAHRPVCTAKMAAPAPVTVIKLEKTDPEPTLTTTTAYTNVSVTTATGTVFISPPVAHRNHLGIGSLGNQGQTSVSSHRPSSLPLGAAVDSTATSMSKAATTMSGGACVTDATGVPITTPSTGMGLGVFSPATGGFTLGLDSMMDGHTGLTPITGAPSCATQHLHRTSSETASSSNSEGVSSPTLLAL